VRQAEWKKIVSCLKFFPEIFFASRTFKKNFFARKSPGSPTIVGFRRDIEDT